MAVEEARVELVPVKTHIVTKRDNIVDVIEKYAGPDMGPDDVVSVAESVVAASRRRRASAAKAAPARVSPPTIKIRALVKFMGKG